MDKTQILKNTFETLVEQGESNPAFLEEIVIMYLNNISEGDIGTVRKQGKETIRICKIHLDYPLTEQYITLVNGIISYFGSDGTNAKKYFESILEPHHKWEHKEIEGCIRLMLGGNYRSLGEFDKCIEQQTIAKKLLRENGVLSSFLIMCYYQLSEVHIMIQELDMAESLLKEGLAIESESLENKFRLFSGLGNLYMKKEEFKEAEKYFILSKEYSKNTTHLARANFDLASLYEKNNELELAAKTALDSYESRISLNLVDAATTSQILIGKIQLRQKKTNEAIETLNNALIKTHEFNAPIKSKQAHSLLAQAYEETQNWKLAYTSFKAYEKIQSDFFSNQQKEIFKLKNQEIRRQKETIEEIHKEVQASIKYAKRIQTAILPPDNIVKQLLPDSFILYKPKDIVAGDFYWVEKKEDTIFFAAADCTGHGVPGAMVSVICNNALNRSLREFDLTDPGLILDNTRTLVIDEFSKSEEDVKDGMDIALVSVSYNDGITLKYAGAHNPLWIIRNNEILETKADKQPIGNFDNLTPYKTHTFNCQKDDVIYIFSDGFVDQFGGKDKSDFAKGGKKFKPKAFRELLLNVHKESLDQQKKLLHEAFEKWRGPIEQVDDLCVLGVKL